jgi:hypothetical protein
MSRPEPLLFLPTSFSIVLNEAEWTLFQALHFLEHLVTPGIEPGTFGSIGREKEVGTNFADK